MVAVLVVVGNQGLLDYFTLPSSIGNIGKLSEPGNNGKSFGNYQCLGDCICWIYLPPSNRNHQDNYVSSRESLIITLSLPLFLDPM